MTGIDSSEGNYVRRALSVFAGYGDRAALRATDGRRFTYTDLCARIRGTAAALWRHGMRPGQTLGILVTNTADSFFVELGSHLIGCRNVMMVPSAPRPFLRTVLDFAGADAFVYEVGTGALGQELAQAAAPRPTFCIGAGGLGPDLVDPPAGADLPFDERDITVLPETLYQTSGTTGTPKLLRHGSRFFAGVGKVASFYAPPDRPMRHLSISGSWHSGNQSAALMTWLAGGYYHMLPSMDVQRWMDAMAEQPFTSSLLAPTLLYQLLDHPRLAELDLSSLHAITICCGAASPARLLEAGRRFGPALNVVYGMSEMPMISALRDAGDPAFPHRAASCGRPWNDVQIQIRDSDGTALTTDEIGEIWVTGESLTEGYYRAPELNLANLVDGWLRTGDVGRIDADGYLYIVDRVNDMIVTTAGALNIFCRPLEDALTSHPQVSQASVVGVPDESMGEAAHAFVIRTEGATVTADELRQHVIEQLNALWAPREVEFIEEFPLTDFGKVDKKALRARYLARLADAGVAP